MVGLLLGANCVLFAFLSPADDVERNVERLELDALDLPGGEAVLLLEFQRALEGGLGVDLGVVLLHDGAPHQLQVFALPIDLEGAGDGLHEVLVPLEDLRGPLIPRIARNAACVAAKAVLG